MKSFTTRGVYAVLSLFGRFVSDAARTTRIQQFRGPVKRGRMEAWWSARQALRTGLSLQEHLKSLLPLYEQYRPQQQHPLPFEITLDHDGEIVQTPTSANEHPLQALLDDPAGEQTPQSAELRFVRILSFTRGWQVLQKLQTLEEDQAFFEAQMREVTDTLRELETEQQREIAGGDIPVSATLKRRLKQRGRPRIPLVLSVLPWGVELIIVSFLLFEAWQLAAPFLNMIGIDIQNLAVEASRNPLGLGAGCGFALGVSTSLAIVWYRFLHATAALLNGISQGFNRKNVLAKAVEPSFLGGLLIGTSMAIGRLRHGAGAAASDLLETLYAQSLSTNVDQHTGAFVLTTILVPLAVAYLHHTLQPVWAARSRVREAQIAWSRAEDEKCCVKERRETLISLEQEKRRWLEQQRNAARDELRVIAQDAHEIEQQIQRTIDEERRFATAYCYSLVAALQTDRLSYLRQARKNRDGHRPTS